MSETGIIETDELISEARDEANREIGRLRAQNESLTQELKRALDKISRLENYDREFARSLLESFWDGESDAVTGERPDPVIVDYDNKTMKIHGHR